MKRASSQNPADWPQDLPRFAESFRVFIDHPEWHSRMMTGAWEHDAGFQRFIQDSAPILGKAVPLGFIASTVPALEHGREREYYGTANPPTVFWHWVDGEWKAQQTREGIARFCERHKTTLKVFDTPRGQEVRP
jgi:hypothetical protein